MDFLVLRWALGIWDSLPAGAVLNQITKSQHQAEEHVANMMQFKNSGVIIKKFNRII